MTENLLVLGGTGFVGGAVVDEALHRGWRVTTFTRGRAAARAGTGRGVHAITGDRMDPRTLHPLTTQSWDLVVDTWAGAPSAARDAAGALATHADRYAYVSSGSVYDPPPPIGADETAPTVAARPDARSTEYPQDKRGAELAVQDAFGDRALLARAGLILGPREDVGRLTWWLQRISDGGEVLAPGPPELPLQFIDARDLARFLLDAPSAGHHGALNVVGRRGHATMGSLLAACVDNAAAPGTRLTWLSPAEIARAGIEPWMQLPIWLPPGHPAEALHGADVERAHAAGLCCRSAEQTVADTYRWMIRLGGPPPQRADLPSPGLDREIERRALAAAHARPHRS